MTAVVVLPCPLPRSCPLNSDSHLHAPAERVLLGATEQKNESETESCAHTHHVDRAQWLRAAVLGANDGLVTVGALLTGINAAEAPHRQLVISAVAAIVSGVPLPVH